MRWAVLHSKRGPGRGRLRQAAAHPVSCAEALLVRGARYGAAVGRAGAGSFTLPRALRPGAEADAVRLLRGYFDADAFDEGRGFTGSVFDGWDPSGDRVARADEFTAADVVAVSFLSVTVAPRAAHRLLVAERSRFADLLHAVGPDRDLVEEERPITARWPARVLNRALMDLPGVGPVVASKLIATKRPRLVPVFDSVVDEYVLGGSGVLWEPLRVALRADGGALHRHLETLRTEAGISECVSALRVFDVVAWREGDLARQSRGRAAGRRRTR